MGLVKREIIENDEKVPRKKKKKKAERRYYQGSVSKSQVQGDQI